MIVCGSDHLCQVWTDSSPMCGMLSVRNIKEFVSHVLGLYNTEAKFLVLLIKKNNNNTKLRFDFPPDISSKSSSAYQVVTKAPILICPPPPPIGHRSVLVCVGTVNCIYSLS